MNSLQNPQFPVTKLFPVEGYKAAPLGYKLHYMAARNQPPGDIQKLLDKGVSLDTPDPTYELTPLAVAAMAGNEAMVAGFLNRGANPLPRDWRNFTPLHYARIINNPKIEQLLIGAAKAKRIALPRLDELNRMLQSRLPKNQFVADRYFQTKGTLISRSPSGFKADTGIEFYDGVLATPDDLIDFWLSIDSVDQRADVEGTNGFYAKALDRYRDNPPHLYYEKGRDDQIKVRANEKIPSFSIIGIHGGKMASHRDENEDSEHRIHEIISEKVGNLPSLIPSGFPNCFFETIHQDGVPLQALVSLKPIEEHEELRVDFGPSHSQKFRDVEEPGQFESYFEENSPLQLMEQIEKVKCLKNEKIDPISVLTQKGMLTRLRYLFTTPFALLTLCLNTPKYIDEIIELCTNPGALAQLGIDKQNKDIVLTLMGCLKITVIETKQELRNHVISFIESFKKHNDLPNVIRMLHTLSEKIDSVKTVEQWHALQKDLLEKSQALDALAGWLKGESSDNLVLIHLKHQNKEYRDSLLLDLETQVKAKYHSKQPDLLRIQADIAIFERSRGEISRETLVKALLKLTPEESDALWDQKEPHFFATLPEKEYDNLLELFLEVLPQLRKVKAQLKARREAVETKRP